MTSNRATGERPRSVDRSTSSSTSPVVSVTIVNHESRDLLRRCLDSLREFPYTLGPMEIVVLDNASDDGSVEMLRADFPDVVVVAENVRRGYGANQNRAINASQGDVIFMLNPDAIVHDHTIDRLAASLRRDERVTIAGGPIANEDGSLRQDRLHRFPTPMSPYMSALGFERLHSRGPMRSAVTSHGWPSGAACLVERSAFDEVGGFDERFFMYSEDTDLFARLVAKDHLVAWVPDAIVTHPLPDESVDLAARREAEIVNAELQYMSEHFRGALVFRIGVAIESSVKLSVALLPGLSGLIRQHGKSLAHTQRVQRARLAAVVLRNRKPRLGDLADEWNRKNAQPSAPNAIAGSGHDTGEGHPTKRNLIVFDSSTT